MKNSALTILRTKTKFRNHLMGYLVMIVILAIINFFVHAEYLWVAWFILIWGVIVFAHYMHLAKNIDNMKKGEEIFLKAHAEELKSGKRPDFSKIAKPVSVTRITNNAEPDDTPAVEDEKMPDLENMEIAKVEIKKGKRTASKKKKTAKKGKDKKKTTAKKRTASKRTVKKRAAKKKTNNKKTTRRKKKAVKKKK